MKKRSFLYILFAVVVGIASCKRQAFIDANTDPTRLYTIKPEEQFLNAAIRAHNSDFEAYYDFYRRIMPWMQMHTPLNGNGNNFLIDIGNFNQRYGVFYPELGGILTDVQKLIEAMPQETQATYAQIYEIADIIKINYAFYVSDINGSIPYTEAFQARYGGTFVPEYDTQQELFNLWDTRLKEVIANLKATPAVTQVALGANDLYYNGDISKWIKAANALRLRMALRLLKRDAAKATTMITEALADPAAQMSSNADGWVMYADQTFNNGGNWNPTEFRAPKPTVDFMWDNSDPRIRMFYQKNDYSLANFNAAKAAGALPATAVWNPRQYVGAHISPDSTQDFYADWFEPLEVTPTLELDTVSYIQWRMWQPAVNSGTGRAFFPVITYADYCFMRAEIHQRNLVTGNAEEWYEKGVEASLRFFDAQAAAAILPDYVALTDQEIATYMAMPEIAYNPAMGLEQIMVQAYINFFRQPNEAWANYKRTGMPNKNTILANEDIVIDGAVRQIPRRAAISIPLPTDQNYATKSAAIQQMASDPNFGQGPTDMFGRVWWDAP